MGHANNQIYDLVTKFRSPGTPAAKESPMPIHLWLGELARNNP